MTLSPDKLAFIRGSGTTPPTVEPKEAKTSAPERTIDLGETKDEPPAERPQRKRSRGKAATQDEPEASEILERMLVPVTIRLQNRTAQALKRASLERELQRIHPHKVQDIAEEAIADWLAKAGYLD